ncbi:MAG TPA: HNH endonuclease signature motif containing protein [Acidimicrobiales bacterium]|nr:HNH endonuclease signature motif containing protein [Acidimicrobiales bacterium]
MTPPTAPAPSGQPGEGPRDDWEHTRADALVALCAQIASQGMAADPGPPAVRVMVHVDEAVLQDPSREGCGHIDGIGAIAAHTAARLACDGVLSRVAFRPGGAVEPEGATRQIPDTIRRAVLARDRGCRFPGCERRAFLHLHHVQFVSQGGPTRASNLAAICSAHHRLIHEGGFRLAMAADGAVRVWNPDGKEIPPGEVPGEPGGPTCMSLPPRPA